MDEFDSATNLINVYDVFGVCYPTPSSHKHHGDMELYESKFLSEQYDEFRTIKNYFTAKDYTPFLYQSSNPHKLKFAPPCVFSQPIWNYLNTKANR